MNDFWAKRQARFVPHKLPGKYCCYLCRELKDAEEFYKDSGRWNGCGSRCKKCDNYRNDWRRGNPGQRFGEKITSLAKSGVKNNAESTTRPNRRQIRKRADDLKSDRLGKDLIPRRWTESDVAILTDAIRNGNTATDMLSLFPKKSLAMLRSKMAVIARDLPPVLITVAREGGLPDITIRQDACEKEMFEAGILIDKIAEIKNKPRVEIYNIIHN